MIHYANDLHSIYMLLSITHNIEITGNVGMGVVHVNLMRIYIHTQVSVLLYPRGVLKLMLLIPRDDCVCFELMPCLLTFHRDLIVDSDALPETGTILNHMSFWISASNKRLPSQSMKFDGFKLGPFGHHLCILQLVFCWWYHVLLLVGGFHSGLSQYCFLPPECYVWGSYTPTLSHFLHQLQHLEITVSSWNSWRFFCCCCFLIFEQMKSLSTRNHRPGAHLS